jgi:alpha-L-glutamate ligase-like protein
MNPSQEKRRDKVRTGLFGRIRQWLGMHDAVMSINRRNVEYVYAWNRRRFFRYADDKVLAKQVMQQHDIPVPATFGCIRGMGDITEAWREVSRKQHLVIKPARGRAGGGILVLEKLSGGWKTPSGRRLDNREVVNRIADIIFGNFSLGISDTALIEERLWQHQLFDDIYSGGIADIRVIVFRGRPVMAMSRVPTRASDGKANLHQGALGIGIDLNSGMLNGGSIKGTPVDRHPDSGMDFCGRQVPCWDEVIAVSKRAGEVFPLKYLGVDLVLDKSRGPVVMEINARPGLEIQNVNRCGLLTRLRQLQNTP